MHDLTEARYSAGLSLSDAWTLCDVSPRTWRRWCRDGAPSWAYRLLSFAGGFMDGYGWPGWRMVRGKLYAPDVAHGWERSDLYAQIWERQLLAELQRQDPDATPYRHHPFLCRRGVPIVWCPNGDAGLPAGTQP